VYEAGGVAGADAERTREADLERHLMRDSGVAGSGAADAGAVMPARAGLGDDFPLNEVLGILEAAGILAAPGTEDPAGSGDAE
jgi:hypothetical protein